MKAIFYRYLKGTAGSKVSTFDEWTCYSEKAPELSCGIEENPGAEYIFSLEQL